MTERPILFSGPMVRAILDGRKTQTRRVVKVFKRLPERLTADAALNDPAQWGWIGAEDGVDAPLIAWLEWCPYGIPGDRLWVRETHSIQSVDGLKAYLAFKERMPPGKTLSDTDGGLDEFELTAEQAAFACDHRDTERWRPSIFMPRWASRITLEVTGVRVQRLQDITIGDAASEGAPARFTHPDQTTAWYPQLWDSLNAKRGYGWAENPWVWVIEFRWLP